MFLWRFFKGVEKVRKLEFLSSGKKVKIIQLILELGIHKHNAILSKREKNGKEKQL